MQAGDEFWNFQVLDSLGLGVKEKVWLSHGVVVGGGKTLIIYRWDGRTAEKETRSRFEARVSRSPLAAMEKAKAELLHARQRHQTLADWATGHLFDLARLLEQEQVKV